MTVVSLFFMSCVDKAPNEGNADNNLSNLTAEPRIGAVILKWANPANPEYYYSMVTFVNSAGDTVKQKVSMYAVDSEKGKGFSKVTIPGFTDTETYTFTVRPFTVDGWPGEKQTVSCTPEDSRMAYKYIAETAVARPLVEGAIVKWTNEFDADARIELKYNNLDGAQTQTLNCSEADSVEIYAFVEPTTVTVTSYSSDGNASEPSMITVTPLRGEIPVNRMFVPAVSSSWENNPAANPGNLLDRNPGTFWHTSIAAPVSPNWFIVDMREKHRVNWIELVRIADGSLPYTPTSVKIEYSNDGFETASEIGTFDFDKELQFNHTYNFDPVDCRWIRCTFDHALGGAYNLYCYMAEFLAYYSDAADHYAAEAAAELMPDPDDDPTYYPEIEYIIPDSRNLVNQVTYEQSNPDNPSQYTYKTSGGDPFVAMQALEKEAAGTVLVFQYQSTHALNCEFFWCPGGYGVGGPAGGKETTFNIQATSGDKWKTFKKNFASDWTTHGWTGKPGDAVRFDVGTVNGATVVIRNMHWRPAVPGE